MEQEQHLTFEDTSIAFSAKSDKDLKKTYWLFATMNKPWVVNIGKVLTKGALAVKLPIKGIIKNTIYEQFCGGETIEESQATIDELAKYHIGTILDFSVEGGEDEAGFERTKVEILKTIEKAKNSSNIPFCVFKPTGLASARIMEKIQSGEELTESEKASFERARNRFFEIGQSAHDHDVRLFVDAEDSWYQNTIDDLVYEMMRQFNKKKAIVYNTYQMYRKDMLGNLKKAFQYAAAHEHFMGAKLVRGAYMEKEAERAEERGYENPIHPTKADTDEAYNQALKFCIDNKQRISVCSGSHNEYSNKYLALLMEKHGMQRNDERVYFAQLYGMSDNISFNLAAEGYNVVKYVPYGPVELVMPYLFRRAEENTSVAGQSGREYRLIKSEMKRRKHT